MNLPPDSRLYPIFQAMSFDRPQSWGDIRVRWANNESQNETWKPKGQRAWQDYRESTFNRFGTRHLRWSLFRIEKPEVVIPELTCGSFRKLRKRFNWPCKYSSKYPTFRELASSNGFEKIKLKDKIQEETEANSSKEVRLLVEYLIRLMDSQDVLIIARKPRGQDHLEVIDGIHYCLAFMLGLANEIKVESKVTIAIGEQVRSHRRQSWNRFAKEFSDTQRLSDQGLA